MALLSDQEIKDLAANIIADSDEEQQLKKLPTKDLKAWLDQGKIKYDNEDLKALETELVGFYGLNQNESSDGLRSLSANEKVKQHMVRLNNFIEKHFGGDEMVSTWLDDEDELKGSIAGFIYDKFDEPSNILDEFRDEENHDYFHLVKISDDIKAVFISGMPDGMMYRKKDEDELYKLAKQLNEAVRKKGPAQMVTESIRALIVNESHQLVDKNGKEIKVGSTPLKVNLNGKWVAATATDFDQEKGLIEVQFTNPRTNKKATTQVYSDDVLVTLLDESFHGDRISYRDLEKGKKYTYTGGAEVMEVTYIGLTNKNPDKKPGSSMGKGFLFQWPDGKYFELGAKSISEFIEETEMPESVQEGTWAENHDGNLEMYLGNKEGTLYVVPNKDNMFDVYHDRNESGKEDYLVDSNLATAEDAQEAARSYAENHLGIDINESKMIINEAKYPMCVAITEDDQTKIHPAFAAMKAGEPLEKFKVMEEFEDDGMPCVNCKAVIGGKTYRFSEWYIDDRKVIKKMYMAEAGDRGAMQGVKNYLIRSGNAVLKQHKAHVKEVADQKAAENAAKIQQTSSTKIKMLEEEYNSLIGLPSSAKRMKEIERALAKLVPDHKLNDNNGLPFKKPTNESSITAHGEFLNKKEFEDHIRKTFGKFEVESGGLGNDNYVVDGKVVGYWTEGSDGNDDFGVIMSTNEAVDDEYFQVESKLKDVCFQYYQQVISQEDAIQQINDIIKDSEDMQNVLVNIAPEAMIDAIISYYNWTESDLAESINDVSDESEAKLRDVVAKFYAGLLPNAEAIKKSKEILDTCDDSGLKEITEGLDDENLMYEIMRHFKWDLYDLIQSVSAE